MKRLLGTLLCLAGGLFPAAAGAQTDSTLTYRVEASANASDGTYAPLWFTANRFGLSSEKPNSGYLRAGLTYRKEMKHYWRLETGVDLAGTANQTADFVVQQLYADIAWKMLTLSVGSKERYGFPLEKNHELSSGMMVEGPNARPVPQVRLTVDYLTVPGTGNWIAMKAHIAYGLFTDGNWQESYVPVGASYTKNVLMHSKSLTMRIGNREKFPMEFEVGILHAAQFGGKRMTMTADGGKLVSNMPNGLKDFFKILIPKHESTLQNVQGNHCGSWNFALTYYGEDWKIQGYLEHYYEDHSQMFWQYGRWKDGQLGLEVTLPKNRWVSALLWEGMATKDQTGPLLYDGVGGSFHDVQQSGGDNYFNNGEYLGWQHWGAALGNPLIPGPQYNADHTNSFKSNRVRSNHVGVSGNPSSEWSYRILASMVRHWGTYSAPLDKQRKQFSSLYEVTYRPAWAAGWSVSAALGLDRGNYLGNSTGGMITLKKTGGLLK